MVCSQSVNIRFGELLTGGVAKVSDLYRGLNPSLTESFVECVFLEKTKLPLLNLVRIILVKYVKLCCMLKLGPSLILAREITALNGF